MAKYHWVTSFNNKLWKGYARNTVPTVYKNRPEGAKFTVYYDGAFNPEWKEAMPDAEFISLDSIADYKHFLTRWAHMKPPPNVPDGHRFRFNWKPFWAKVCAIRSARDTNEKGLIWVDADVGSNKPIKESRLDMWLGDGDMAALVRGQPWNTWDSGFMIFKWKSVYVRTFVEDVYDTYMSGRMFDYNEWHDAYIFTVVYKSYKTRFRITNLNMMMSAAHPFDSSVLPPYLVHLKGMRKNTGEAIDPTKLNGVFRSEWTGARNVREDPVIHLGKDFEFYEADF